MDKEPCILPHPANQNSNTDPDTRVRSEQRWLVQRDKMSHFQWLGYATSHAPNNQLQTAVLHTTPRSYVSKTTWHLPEPAPGHVAQS